MLKGGNVQVTHGKINKYIINSVGVTMFDDIYLFINLVKAGSYSRAAKDLGLHQSTLSRRIESLEQVMKIRLIKSVSYGRIELTDEGLELYNNATEHFNMITNTVECINMQNKSLHGDFNIVIPALLHLVIGPMISNFLTTYPDINIHISNYNANIATYDQPFDFALSFLQPDNPNYIVSVLYNVPVSLYATPEYLAKHGTPHSLADLQHHQVIVPTVNDIRYTNWHALNTKTNQMESVLISHPKGSYDGAVGGKFLTLAHQGISYIADIMAAKEIKNNQLVKILPEYTVAPLSLYIVKPDNNVNAKTTAFIGYIKELLPVILKQYELLA